MAVVSTGFFDGVHKGHQKVIKTLVCLAHSKGEQAIVLTFGQHPRAVLQQDARNLKLLSSCDEKVSMIKALGVDKVEVLEFSKDFASLSAEQYIKDILIEKYGATELVLGYDNRLGSDKLTPEMIVPIADKLGLALKIVDADGSQGGEPVSSTKIRAAIAQGLVEDAEEMLGYCYPLSGVVVSGKQYGRTIGFPTANMQLCDPRKLLPARGVYLTQVTTLSRQFFGMTNVGDIVETHILDFEEDIYGLEINIQFKKRLRDMRRFESGDDLKSQLASDEKLCRALCADLQLR